MEKVYITVTQSMSIFKVTRQTILKWINDGKLKNCIRSRNKWLIPEESIDEYLEVKPKKKKPVTDIERLDNWFMELKRAYHPRRVNDQLQTAYNLFIRTMGQVSFKNLGGDIFGAQLEQQLIFYHSIEKIRDSSKWSNHDGKFLPGFGNFLRYVVWQQREDPSVLRKYIMKKDSEMIEEPLIEEQNISYNIKLN